MSEVKAKPKVKVKEKDKPKCKEWERRRRQKLNDAFDNLAELLPNYDPAKSPPKIDILERSTDFIKELRLSNARLVSQGQDNKEKGGADERSKLIKELQDEVNRLILRVKQLTTLLKSASIPIPKGPHIRSLGRRRLKWTRDGKEGSSDEENEGEGGEMEGDQDVVTVSLTMASVSVSPATATTTTTTASSHPLRELNGTAGSVTTTTLPPNHNQLTNPEEIENTQNSGSRSMPVTIFAGASQSESAETQTPPVTVVQPQSAASTTTDSFPSNPAVVTTTSATTSLPINTATTGINPILAEPIPMSLSAPTILPMSTIFLTQAPNQSSPIIARITMGPPNLLTTGCGTFLEKIPILPIRKSIPKVKFKRKRRIKVPVTEVVEVEKASTSIVEGASANQVTSDKGEEQQDKNPPLLAEDAENQSDKPEQGESAAEAISADSCNIENGNGPDAGANGADNENSSKSDKQMEKPAAEREAVHVVENLESLVTATESQQKQNEAESLVVTLEIELENQTTRKTAGKEAEDRPVEATANKEQNGANDDATAVLPNVSAEVNLESVIVQSTANNDTSQRCSQDSVAPSLPAETPKLPAVPTTSVEVTVTSPSSPSKISECIARSIDLIEAQDGELMELGDNWGDAENVNSPKTPASVSPTQMFLNMFPLLPRDSQSQLTSVSTSDPIRNPASVYSSHTPRSFFIDAMLPDEESSQQSQGISNERRSNRVESQSPRKSGSSKKPTLDRRSHSQVFRDFQLFNTELQMQMDFGPDVDFLRDSSNVARRSVDTTGFTFSLDQGNFTESFQIQTLESTQPQSQGSETMQTQTSQLTSLTPAGQSQGRKKPEAVASVYKDVHNMQKTGSCESSRIKGVQDRQTNFSVNPSSSSISVASNSSSSITPLLQLETPSTTTSTLTTNVANLFRPQVAPANQYSHNQGQGHHLVPAVEGIEVPDSRMNFVRQACSSEKVAESPHSNSRNGLFSYSLQQYPNFSPQPQSQEKRSQSQQASSAKGKQTSREEPPAKRANLSKRQSQGQKENHKRGQKEPPVTDFHHSTQASRPVPVPVPSSSSISPNHHHQLFDNFSLFPDFSFSSSEFHVASSQQPSYDYCADFPVTPQFTQQSIQSVTELASSFRHPPISVHRSDRPEHSRSSTTTTTTNYAHGTQAQGSSSNQRPMPFYLQDVPTSTSSSHSSSGILSFQQGHSQPHAHPQSVHQQPLQPQSEQSQPYPQSSQSQPMLQPPQQYFPSQTQKPQQQIQHQRSSLAQQPYPDNSQQAQHQQQCQQQQQNTISCPQGRPGQHHPSHQHQRGASDQQQQRVHPYHQQQHTPSSAMKRKQPVSGSSMPVQQNQNQRQFEHNPASSSKGSASTTSNSSSHTSQPQHINWMTDGKTTSQANRNPFSVSKLVGLGSSSGTPNPSGKQQQPQPPVPSSRPSNSNSYCAEALIRKNSSTQPQQPWNASMSMSRSVPMQPFPPASFTFSQPGSHHYSSSGQGQGQGHGFEDYPFSASSSCHFQSSQNQSGHPQGQPHYEHHFHHMTPSASSGQGHSLHYHHQDFGQGQGQQGSSGNSGTVSNFNLSSIFPEMNDKMVQQQQQSSARASSSSYYGHSSATNQHQLPPHPGRR